MSAQQQQLSPEEEQDKLLNEAKNVVNVQAFHMKRCLDNAKLMDALKHASNMISELRTSLLSPKTYYALYIHAFDQLRYLGQYLFEEKHGKKMSELYELVQYAGNIIPRLYLLVTVGAVYIKSKEAPAKDVLRDMVEMCRGVQHPTRGLFLRTYVTEMTKDKLPDIGNDYDGRGGSVQDSVDFVLSNFTEMNKLWVRMQHQGPARDRERRENERLELRILVGKSLAPLSMLDGVTSSLYAASVLPRIVEQIVACKDRIAQQYLMEIVIQMFPDEHHLATLDQLLGACAALQPGVDVRQIIAALVDRLAQYAAREPTAIPANVDIFDVFFKHVTRVVEERSGMEPGDVLALCVSLVTLALKCYASRLECIERVLAYAADYLNNVAAEQRSKPAVSKQLVALLTSPLDVHKDILVLLALPSYTRASTFLSHATRKKVAVDIVRSQLDNSARIHEADQVGQLLEFIAPLVRDEPSATDADAGDDEDFAEEQNLVASLVHLFDAPADPEKLFTMYITARKYFGLGGPNRMRHTLVPLVMRALALMARLQQQRDGGVLALGDEEWGKIGRKIFKFVHETITALARTKQPGQPAVPELALRLFLQAGQAACACGFEVIAYEFFTQVWALYEEDISDSRAQFAAISLIVASLQAQRCFGDENFDALVTRCAQHSSKLLKKPDQCHAIYLCSHLFWLDPVALGQRAHRDAKRVLECLQKALKIAEACMDATTNVALFVEILNQYLYYFEAPRAAQDEPPAPVTAKHLSGMVALINTNIANMDSAAPDHAAISAFYQNTLRYIQWARDTQGAAFAEVEV